MKISDTKLRSIELPVKGYRIEYDSQIPGFGVRITAKGIKSFILNYYIHKKERRITIGRFPDWSTEAARNEAMALRKEASQGDDPLEKRNIACNAPTMAKLADHYMETHAKRKKRESSQAQDQLLIDNWIKPRLGAKRLENIDNGDIDDFHHAMKGTPYQANRALALLSKMYSTIITKNDWACTVNPVKGVERFQEPGRERYLTNEELKRLALALTEYPKYTSVKGEEKIHPQRQQSSNILRLLLLTGARKGETFKAMWDQFDLDNGIWTKPSAHTKQDKDHEIPLSGPAKVLINEIKNMENDSPYLFPGPEGHQTDIKRAWKAICKMADLENLRVHDLRHSYASNLVSAGFSLPIIGALLGHTQPGTTARYAHLMDDPLREATEKMGAIYTHAETGKTGKVVSLFGEGDK